MRHFFLLCSLVFLGGCTWLSRFNPPPNPDPNHTHADFAVWIDGEKLDFSHAKYMSGFSDAEEEGKHPHKHLHEYFHLHDGIGHVIHRHKPGLTIGEFFTSLGFRVEGGCLMFEKKRVCNMQEKEWKLYVNGELRPFDLGFVFEDGDKILLMYGSGGDQVARELAAMTDDACRYSKTCPWKGEPPAENCIADPAVPCMAPL